MMSKSSQEDAAPSASADGKESSVTMDETAFFHSSCLETLEDGKLVLSYSAAGSDKEPAHTGKWTDEEMVRRNVGQSSLDTFPWLIDVFSALPILCRPTQKDSSKSSRKEACHSLTGRLFASFWQRC